MRVLVIGGNRFLGLELVTRLLAHGHDVTLFNRGTLPDPFGQRVHRLRGDRGGDAFDRQLAGTVWDAVFDFALFTAEQAQRTARVLTGRVGHFIGVSSGQVYLVRDVVPVPAHERDFDGALMGAPTTPYDLEQWRYGIEKRDIEGIITRALPTSLVRLPMVHGGRDYYRRLDSIAYRLLDHGPLLVTRPDARVQHVYAPAVVRHLHRLLARGPSGAFNLAQPDFFTVRAFLERLGEVLGVTPHLEVTTPEALLARGLDPLKACPFNQRWMSALDPSLAIATQGFTHEPIEAWLPAALHASMARWHETPPPSLEQRARELA
jgi:2'-hydroxyisoflavone reductase